MSADTSDGPSPQKKERMQRRLDRIEKRQHKLETERKKKEQENLLLEQKEVEYVNCAVAENVHTPRYPPGNSSVASYFASKTLAFKATLHLNFQRSSMGWVCFFFSGTAPFEMNIGKQRNILCSLARELLSELGLFLALLIMR